MISLLAFWMGGAGAAPAVTPVEVLLATVLSLNAENTVEVRSAVNTVVAID